MTDTFKIFLDRLTEGNEQDLDDVIPSDLIFANEHELKFGKDTTIKGKAYLASDHLVIDIYAKVEVKMPCIICSKWVPFVLEMEKQTHTIPIEDVKNKIYNYQDLIKESILLQIPQTIECASSCPERPSIAQFLVKEEKDLSKHFPFSGLE